MSNVNVNLGNQNADDKDNKNNTGVDTTGTDTVGVDNTDTVDNGSDNTDITDKGANAVKTFTQEQVSRMMAREKNQGRNAVLNELGIDPKDKQTIAMIKSFMEMQKKTQEPQADNSELLEAQARAAKAEAKAEAMMLGIKPEFADDAVALILAKVTDDADIKTLVGDLKQKYPTWFGKDEPDDGKHVGKKGTGSTIKTKTTPADGKGNGNGSLGSRLAAKRVASSNKKSFWG